MKNLKGNIHNLWMMETFTKHRQLEAMNKKDRCLK